MDESWETIKTLIFIAIGVMNVINSIWMFVADRRMARKTEVDDKLSNLNDRLIAAEQAAAAAPDHEDLGKIYEQNRLLAESVNRMVGEFNGVKNTLQLLVEHHMQGPK